MHPFRLNEPIRRDNRRECEHYNSYRKTLREDFNYRCGYCDSHDMYRIRSFTIDHFVPQTPANFKCTIAPNFYYNLVYSCRYCNEAKSNKWPTADERVHHNGKEGFVDPITKEYTDLYKRNSTGRIIPVDQNNELAKYIIRELKFWKPIYEKMWKIEKLDSQLNQLEEGIITIIDPELKNDLLALRDELTSRWREIQKGIYAENA